MKTIIRILACLTLLLFSLSAKAAPTLTPDFDLIAPGWIAPPLTQVMDPYWAAFGLPNRGINYYSSGAPTSPSPYWERFDPTSPLYEAWFGAYVTTGFPCVSEWQNPTSTTIPCSVENVLALTSADQYVWLAAYGDPSPLALVDTTSVRVFGPDCEGFFVVYAQMASHSDLGSPISLYGIDPPYSLYASDVPMYQPVTLNALARFKYDPCAGELVIAYMSGTEWETLDGACHSTPPDVIVDQLAMVFKTSFH